MTTEHWNAAGRMGWQTAPVARRRSGTTAPICTWHLGDFQGTTLFEMQIAGTPNTQARWLLEHAP